MTQEVKLLQKAQQGAYGADNALSQHFAQLRQMFPALANWFGSFRTTVIPHLKRGEYDEVMMTLQSIVTRSQ